MQKKGLTVVIIAIAVLSVGFYITNQEIKKRDQEIARNFQKIGEKLPPDFKQESIFSRGLFSSTGVYKLNYKKDEKSDNLLIDYSLEHGFSSWFGGDIKFHSTVKVNGDSFKAISVSDPQWMVVDGVIKKDGSFDMKGVGAKAKIVAKVDGSQMSAFNIDPSNLSISYNKTSGMVKAGLIYPTMTLNGKENVIIKNVELESSFSMAQSELGDFSLKVEKITSDTINLKGFDVYVKSELENNKLNILTSFKVNDLSLIPLGQKDIKIELSYSFKGIDKVAIDIYKEIYEPQSKQKEMTEQEVKAKVIEGFKQVLKTGLIINLDKLSVKNKSGLLDFNGAIEIKPSLTVEDISFEKNTKLRFDLLITGDYAKMFKLMAPEEQSDIINLDEKNNIKLSLVFDNGVFKLNNKEFSPEYTDQINAALQGLDEQLKK